MDKKTGQLITSVTENLLKRLEIQAQVSVSEQDGATQVIIESDEAGVLIGHHGRNLEALQILVGQLIFKQLGEWVRIVLTVGDYRERRKQQLTELAESAAARVVETQAPVELGELTPAERRIIHMVLTDHPQVATESVGEGRDRKLTVKPRT